MKCKKCGGLVSLFGADEPKCFNCGWHPPITAEEAQGLRKEAEKKKSEQWGGRHRDRSNERATRSQARAYSGLCPRCGKQPPAESRKWCQECTDKEKERVRDFTA